MAELTYLQAISDGLRTELRRDKRVFVIVPSETETPIWGITTSTAVSVAMRCS